MQETWGPPLRQGPAVFGLGGVPQALGCVTGGGAGPLGWPAGGWTKAEKTHPGGRGRHCPICPQLLAQRPCSERMSDTFIDLILLVIDQLGDAKAVSDPATGTLRPRCEDLATQFCPQAGLR